MHIDLVFSLPCKKYQDFKTIFSIFNIENYEQKLLMYFQRIFKNLSIQKL